MALRICISGFGRVGRAIFRANWEQGNNFEVAAIKDIMPVENSACLLKHDSDYGEFEEDIKVMGENLVIGGIELPYFKEKENSKIPLKGLDVDILVDASGIDSKKADRKIISGKLVNVVYTRNSEDVDITLVYGVNNEEYRPAKHKLISAGSCTGNAMAPIAKVIEENFGIVEGHFVVVHPALSDQKLLDSAHPYFTLGRNAMHSIIPYKTNIAKSTIKVIPSLEGKLTASSYRVPTTAVTAINANFKIKNETTMERLKEILKKLEPEKLVKYDEGFMQYPKTSIDYIKCPYTSIVLGTETRVEGKKLSISIFHDNEWGYACRVNDLLNYIHKQNKRQ